MKLKVTLLSCICLLSVHTFAQEKLYTSQNFVETSLYKNNPGLTGDVGIKTFLKETSGEKSFTTFEIEVPQSGSYYLNAWMLPSGKPDGSFTSYEVHVNGTALSAKLRAEKSGWQSLELPETLSLKAGINKVSISTLLPEIPQVEFVKLSTTRSKAAINSEKYDNFAANVASGSLENRTMQTAAATLTDTPLANFTGYQNVGIYYTFHVDFVFYEGQQYFVATNGKNNHPHILEIHNITDPETYSWSSESNSEGLASLNINIPYSGTYYIRVRSKTPGTSGLVDVNVNGWINFENSTVSNLSYFTVRQPAGTVYNTFTAHSTSDPILCIESGTAGKTVGWNRDYRTSPNESDFSWGQEARVKQRFTNGADAVTVSAQYAYDAGGTCELYIGCMNSTILSYFENLKADDAIQSAPQDGTYNCISWSGGITDYWEWPLDVYSDYYVSGNDLASFDKFYSYPRYPGCAIYSRSGVTNENAVIDLWAIHRGNTYLYTHGSIKAGSDGRMHGYDWESKPGGLMRTFHPREALTGNSYGQITYSYRRIGTANAYSLVESIADGRAVLENVSFSTLEMDVIEEQINRLSVAQINRFTDLYEVWKETWKDSPYSNPDAYRNEAYDRLLEYCRSLSASPYLVYRKLAEGEVFNLLLVQDLTLKEQTANQLILESVKTVNQSRTATAYGSTIVRSPYSNCMKYVKELLRADVSNSSILETDPLLTGNEDIRYSNSDVFNVATNGSELLVDFVLDDASSVRMEVITRDGRLVNSLVNSQSLPAGTYQCSASLSPGIYLIKFLVNGNLNIKKVWVQE